MHTDSEVKSPQWLHHLQFSGLYAFWLAPGQSVSWLNWMSLPNKLKCSHTVITLRCSGGFTLHEPQSLCTFHVGLWDWSEKGDMIHYWFSYCLFHTSTTLQIYIFFVSFLLKICSKWKVTVFFECLDASFVVVGAALTFLPIERQIVVKLMLARKQNKGWWDGV